MIEKRFKKHKKSILLVLNTHVFKQIYQITPLYKMFIQQRLATLKINVNTFLKYVLQEIFPSFRLMAGKKTFVFASVILTLNVAVAQTCPFGSATSSTGYGVIAVGGNTNPGNAVGAINVVGTTLATGNSATLSTANPLTIDLKAWVSQGSTLTVAWARSAGTPTATVQYSLDSITFTSLGTLSGATTALSLYATFTVPAGGLRYIRIARTAGTLFIDGVMRTHTCYYPVNAVNDTRVFMSPGTGKGFIGNNDVNLDLDARTYSLGAINASNGTLSLSSGGYYTYTPNTNFDGVDFFSYRVCDAGPDGNIATTTDNGCDTAIVTLRSLFNCDSTKFYVPLPENEAMDFLRDIYSTNNDTTQVYIGLSVSTDAVVVYDHWEDGYESNIKAPTQSTTRIWGDGDLSNGVAPGFPTDFLDAGKAIILSNKLMSGHSGSTTYNPNGATSDNTLQATVDYDGKDKVFVGGNGALTKFAWGSLGTVSVSGASVPTAAKWGTAFTVPIGINTANKGNSVDIASLSIMAKDANTIIQIDRDANGSVDIRDTLNEGETYYVDTRQGGTVINVNQGATISSNKPVMVYLMTGRYNTVPYQGRTYSLNPNNQLSTCYYMPAVPNLAVRNFLYNPTGSAISVTRTTAGGATSTISVAANSSNFDDVNSSGLGFRYCSTVPFIMIALCDYNNGNSDWGFTPVPTANLTNKVLMSFGDGADPTNAAIGTVNYTVAHVMVDSTTYLYVDVNGDGTPDNVSFNTDVDASDNPITVGGVNYNETTSGNGILMNPYQTITIGSTTGSLNGALLYTKTAANNGGNLGKNLVVVWGQNGGPITTPNIDAGYTVPNINPFMGGTSIIKTTDSLCLGSNLDSITVKYSGVAPYRVFWFNEATNTYNTTTTSKDSFVIYNLEPGTYLVKVKDANCNVFQQRTTIYAATTGCSFTVTGRLFNDSNGLTNSLIDGRGFGNPSSSSMYVYLVNNLGLVIDSSLVNPSNGTYSLTGVRYSNYTLRLATVAAGIGATAPASSLPSGWVNTGEQFGTGNFAGTGIETGNANGSIALRILTSNISNVNLGIERVPVSGNQTYSINSPSFSLTDTMRLNRTSSSPGALLGTDAEDGTFGSGSKVRLYAPTTNELFYDANNDGVLAPGERITDSLEISSYNPSLLIARYSQIGSTSMSFQFSYVDRANKIGSKATYGISWLIPLPTDELQLTINCADKVNQLSWFVNTDKEVKSFDIRWSADGKKWYTIQSATANSQKKYEYEDKAIHSGQSFYKILMQTTDGVEYSTAIVKSPCLISDALKYELYPVPAQTVVYLRGYDGSEAFKVYNAQGLEVHPSLIVVNGISELHFEEFSDGVYSVVFNEQGTYRVLIHQ